MAISAPHCRLFKSLKPILPQGGRLLEIGEANWYGDLDPKILEDDAWSELDSDRARELLSLDEMPGRVVAARRVADGKNLFEIAKAFYAATFAPSKMVSIDFNGSESALRQDLNAPLELEEQFDLAINHGTAEHIFNIAQVFRTMHDHTVGGGLMIHESPFTGWVDHGFYCLQPTLFYDLAAANNYEIVMVAIEHIDTDTTIRLESRDHAVELAKACKLPNNAMLFVVYRKMGEGPLRVPMQGYYAQALSNDGKRAWEELR